MRTESPPRPSPPKRRRERLGPFVLFVLACGLAVTGLVWPDLERARRIVEREDLARDTLTAIQAAEVQFHQTSGRYGFVRDLAGAGLLADLSVVETDGVPWVETDGYRIEVLLPHARLGPGIVGIVPDGSGEPIEADLAARHYSVVARPLEPGVSGFRMWYIDEQDEFFLNEGVIDDASAMRNELPTRQVVRNASLDSASHLIWQKASEVPPKED